MEDHHLKHLAYAIGGISNTSHLCLTGIQSVAAVVAQPSRILKGRLNAQTCVQFILFDNDKPDEHTRLINKVLGEDSEFQGIHGYCTYVRPHHDPGTLPQDWERRVIRRNLGLTRGPAIYSLSPTDYVLSNLVSDEPEPTLQMELITKGYVKTGVLLERLQAWRGIDAESRSLARARLRQLVTLDELINTVQSSSNNTDLPDAAIALIARHRPIERTPSFDERSNILPITGRRAFQGGR